MHRTAHACTALPLHVRLPTTARLATRQTYGAPSSTTVAAGVLAYGSTCCDCTDMAQNRFNNIKQPRTVTWNTFEQLPFEPHVLDGGQHNDHAQAGPRATSLKCQEQGAMCWKRPTPPARQAPQGGLAPQTPVLLSRSRCMCQSYAPGVNKRTPPAIQRHAHCLPGRAHMPVRRRARPLTAPARRAR